MACSFDPSYLKGAPIGMFHCPECGEMVIAGLEHPNYSLQGSLSEYVDRTPAEEGKQNMNVQTQQEWLYCIECEGTYPVEMCADGFFVHFIDIDSACEGPFATCPPPYMSEEMWDAALVAADAQLVG